MEADYENGILFNYKTAFRQQGPSLTLRMTSKNAILSGKKVNSNHSYQLKEISPDVGMTDKRNYENAIL